MVFVAAFVPVTVKTEQLINRENFKINYGYNPTLDPDTDNAENKAVPRVSPGEHVPDIQSDGNKAKTWKIHAELVEWLYRGMGPWGEGRGERSARSLHVLLHHSICLQPAKAPFLSVKAVSLQREMETRLMKAGGSSILWAYWAPPPLPERRGGHTKASYQHSLA